MSDPSPTSDDCAAAAAAAALARAVADYRADENVGRLHAALMALIHSATADTLVTAVEPYRDIPEVAGPVYEHVVLQQPGNARALVILANAYWLTGRGPEVVGELAARALAIDQTNRGAWHLWALTESRPRQRVERWRAVTARFPDDDLALASLADNAASLAGAEQDPAALALALDAYGTLRSRAQHPAQRAALDQALGVLRGWRL
jgi:hypothetical protein